MGNGQQFSKNLFLSLSVAYWEVNNMRNCTFYIDFFPSEIQKIFSFLLLWLWLLIAKRACMQKIYLVIFEQLFLAKLSLTPFLNQLLHLFSTTAAVCCPFFTSSCDMKKETFGTKKKYPLLHPKMPCSTTNHSYIISSRRKKMSGDFFWGFFLPTLMSSSVT